MKKIFLCLIAFFLIGSEVSAAVKINTSFTAGTLKYSLFYAIPDNYDPAKKYPLVVGLHYCGGSGNMYRNSLTPLADSLQVIIACPDNSGNIIPDDRLGIVTAAADSARIAYSIDTTAMYLTGMSCNGEFTLRKGLEKFYPFTGIFPWVPWIQNRNQFNSYLIGSDMPTVLAVGTYDDNFGLLMSLYDSLKSEGANVDLVLALNIGHTADFTEFGNTMITCIRYLTSPKTISVGKIEDFTMLNTDPAKEITVDISTTGSKELEVKVIVSNDYTIEVPVVSYNPAQGNATISFTPKTGKKGTLKIIVEAVEKDGPAIGQSVFNLKIEKPTAAASFEEVKDKLIVSPNPAKGLITMESQQPINEFEIYDFSGKLVFKGNSSDKRVTINVSSLPKGNYLLKTSVNIEPVRFGIK